MNNSVRNTPRHFLHIVLTCVIATGIFQTATAQVSPHKYSLFHRIIHDADNDFYVRATFNLHTSNTLPDTIKVRVNGIMQRSRFYTGCLRMKVEYLDRTDTVLGTEHSKKVKNNSPGLFSAPLKLNFYEFSVNPHYRAVRLTPQSGSTCGNLQDFSYSYTLYLEEPVFVPGGLTSTIKPTKIKGVLGEPDTWVLDVKNDFEDSYEAIIRWQIATNPAPIPDRGDAEITAKLTTSPYVCKELIARYLDNQGNTLGTTTSGKVCSGKDVVLSNFASNANLRKISLQLKTTRINEASQETVSLSPVRTFSLY